MRALSPENTGRAGDSTSFNGIKSKTSLMTRRRSQIPECLEEENILNIKLIMLMNSLIQGFHLNTLLSGGAAENKSLR